MDTISNNFLGAEQLVCDSLFSWVNAGSHGILDEGHAALDDSQIQIYLAVFRRIFEESGHAAHYRMMMREVDSDQVLDASAL